MKTKPFEGWKIVLDCGVFGACPAVEVTAEDVTIGEDSYTVRLHFFASRFALEMPCSRHRSAVGTSASCSRGMAVICSSENRFRFMVRLLSPPTSSSSRASMGALAISRSLVTLAQQAIDGQHPGAVLHYEEERERLSRA